MNLLEITLEDVIIWGYSIVGSLFIFYFFIIFLQREINNKIRLSLSTLFFSIGLFFFNSAGRILTGYSEGFTVIALINALLLAGIGLVCVHIIHKESRKRK